MSGGRIRILDNWEQHNITKVLIPQLKGVLTYGGKFSGIVRWHKIGVSQLKAAWAEVEAAGLLDDVKFWDGSFVPRMKRGSTTSPSEHAFGVAFDINAEWNGFKQRPAPKGTYGSVARLLPIFRAHGFECGADWQKTPDGMHFQIRKLMNEAPTPEPTVEAPPQTSIILVTRDGAKRLPTLRPDGQNWAQVRATLGALGLEIEREGEWGDGSPALFVKL